MVALALVAASGPMAIAQEDGPTQTVETLENDEDLYLSFGADLGDMTLDEYVEEYADDNPSGDENAEIIQYQDVDQVNIHEQGEAVSIAIGGGDATAIQESNQQNTNAQEGDATAENEAAFGHETAFEDVNDVYVVMGEGNGQQFDGWSVVDGDGETTVSQEAEASVTQGQAVGQANVNQNTTAFAYAEDGSSATAVQLTEQSNLNLQEGAANATNIYMDEFDGDDIDKHKKTKDGTPSGIQYADSEVEQVQDVEQVNVNEQGAAVAVAVGEDSDATAVQISDQSNLNEQLGTAEAINVMMESAGMNVATASIDGGNEIVSEDGATYEEPKDKKGDDADGADVAQTAEASVTQYQSVEQVNINVDSAAQAIAVDGGDAQAVQLTFQQNINAQVGSATALNIFLDGDDEIEEGSDYEGVLLTNSTVATINGETVEDVDRLSFDYDGDNEQLNDVEQYSTAEVEQSQNVSQANLHSNTALAVAEDDGDANAFQMTMQENQNVQVSDIESTSANEPPADESDESDDETGGDETVEDGDGDAAEASEASASDDESDESLPGFGIAVALVAMLAAAMVAVRAQH